MVLSNQEVHQNTLTELLTDLKHEECKRHNKCPVSHNRQDPQAGYEVEIEIPHLAIEYGFADFITCDQDDNDRNSEEYVCQIEGGLDEKGCTKWVPAKQFVEVQHLKYSNGAAVDKCYQDPIEEPRTKVKYSSRRTVSGWHEAQGGTFIENDEDGGKFPEADEEEYTVQFSLSNTKPLQE